jgi:6-phosphogluconolactonase (cycloisomerase 2 family)
MPGGLICVGSYTAETGGSGPGLTVFPADIADGVREPLGELALPACSWLARHPGLPVLYAANELARGTVTAVEPAPDGRSFRVLGSAPTGGAEPCQLAVTPDGRHLLAANYGSGDVTVLALDTHGAPAGRTGFAAHTGSGPVADRQDGPHAHMITLDAAGTLVCVTDLGSDTLWSYRLEPSGALTPVAAGALPPGTGPRQLLRTAPGRAQAVAELSGALLTLGEDSPGVFSVRAAAPASGRPGPNQPAQFSASPDGRFGYLSNRGPDTLAVFDLTTDPPAAVAEYPLHAAWPRHLAVTADRVYVAAQHADAVVVLAREPDTGALRELHRLPVGSPACVLPFAVGPRRHAEA